MNNETADREFRVLKGLIVLDRIHRLRMRIEKHCTAQEREWLAEVILAAHDLIRGSELAPARHPVLDEP